MWGLGTLGLIVGSTIFAAVTWRTAVLSRPAVALLGAPVLVVLLALAGISGGIVAESVSQLFAVACLFLFAAGWAAVGWSALRLDRSATATASA